MAGSPTRWTLLVSVLGSSMAFLDGTLVNVALPVMQRELSIDVGVAQWIVEAYLLLLSSFVLVGGALGDRFGRRRVFVAGVILFALASLACGLAPGASLLIAARAVQGLGAALLVPGSLSLITAAYPDATERGAAIGTWSAASAMTTMLEPAVRSRGDGWSRTRPGAGCSSSTRRSPRSSSPSRWCTSRSRAIRRRRAPSTCQARRS